MAEHEQDQVAGEVDAHGLKEVAVVSISAAALVAGASDAFAAKAPTAKSPDAKQAAQKVAHASEAAFKQQGIKRPDYTVKLSADPTLKRADKNAS